MGAQSKLCLGGCLRVARLCSDFRQWARSKTPAQDKLERGTLSKEGWDLGWATRPPVRLLGRC